MPHMRAWGEQQAAMHKANSGGGEQQTTIQPGIGKGEKRREFI